MKKANLSDATLLYVANELPYLFPKTLEDEPSLKKRLAHDLPKLGYSIAALLGSCVIFIGLDTLIGKVTFFRGAGFATLPIMTLMYLGSSSLCSTLISLWPPIQKRAPADRPLSGAV